MPWDDVIATNRETQRRLMDSYADMDHPCPLCGTSHFESTIGCHQKVRDDELTITCQAGKLYLRDYLDAIPDTDTVSDATDPNKVPVHPGLRRTSMTRLEKKGHLVDLGVPRSDREKILNQLFGE